jgi:molybdate transport system regulatory protein
MTMRLSTRNQFPGKVVSITTGEAMAVVKIQVDGTDLVVTAAITAEAVNELGLAVGASAYALVKATEVQLAVD